LEIKPEPDVAGHLPQTGECEGCYTALLMMMCMKLRINCSMLISVIWSVLLLLHPVMHYQYACLNVSTHKWF